METENSLKWLIAPDGFIPNSVIRSRLWPDDCPCPLDEKLPNIKMYNKQLITNKIMGLNFDNNLLSELVNSLWFDISVEGMDLKTVIEGLFEIMDKGDEQVYEFCMDGLSNIMKNYEAPKQLETKIVKKLLKDSIASEVWKTKNAQKMMDKLELKSAKVVHLAQTLQDPNEDLRKAAIEMLKQETETSDLKSLVKLLKSEGPKNKLLDLSESMRKVMIQDLKKQLVEEKAKELIRKLPKIKSKNFPGASQDSILKGRVFTRRVSKAKKDDEHTAKTKGKEKAREPVRSLSKVRGSIGAETHERKGFVTEEESRLSSASSLQLLTLKKVEESKATQVPDKTKLPPILTLPESDSITDIRIQTTSVVPSQSKRSSSDVFVRTESSKLGLSSQPLAERIQIPFIHKMTSSSIKATLAPDANPEDWRSSLYELVNTYGKRAASKEDKPDVKGESRPMEMYKKQVHGNQQEISPGQRVLDTILHRTLKTNFNNKLWHIYSLPWQQSFVTVKPRGISRFGMLGMTWSTCDFTQIGQSCEWVRNSSHRIDSSIVLKKEHGD